MKRLAFSLIMLLLPVLSQAGPIFTQPTPPSLAADPATCSTTGAWYQKFYYNTVSNQWKYCSATNTWSAFGGGTISTGTGVQIGDGAGGLTGTNVTVGVVATDAVQAPGGFFGTSLASDNTIVANKGAILSAGKLIIATTSQTTPTFLIVNKVDASHAYAQATGQASAVSSGATTAGDYVLPSASAAGSFDDSATCPAGDWYMGKWLTTNVAGGTYAVNLSPGWCPSATVEHVIAWDVQATGDAKKYLPVYFACTIYAVDVTADQSGTFAADIDRHNVAIPNTTTDKISGTDGPALAAAQLNLAHAPSSWGSVTIASGDVLNLNVTTFTTVTNVHVQARCH